MPAAPRGRTQDAPTYSPTSSNFVSVHAEYKKAAETAGCASHVLQTFLQTMVRKCPEIKFMKPREDVCAHCEQFRATSSATGNSEEVRVKLLSEWRDRIELAQDECQFYNTCAVKAKDATEVEGDELEFSHMTFGFSENFALPYHARQPGPVYFKVMLRINDFGVMNEGLQKQHHYLYTEAQCIGSDNSKSHGPNNVVSMIHYYLTTTSHSRVLHFHCDNCGAQNKNKSVMAYMAWRILVGLEHRITVSFMVVGNTRCAVDGGIRLAKKKIPL